ncbi:MAG: DUF4007 family protein [Leptospiraceae bacterium]|nr:DUF4007 family protein [Leptospiraceae bacterium]
MLQYLLLTNENTPTTWYWFFTQSELTTLNKDSFIISYKEWLDLHFDKAYSEKTVENDFSTLVYLIRIVPP